jgi:lysophospholipase L1-like esterase
MAGPRGRPGSSFRPAWPAWVLLAVLLPGTPPLRAEAVPATERALATPAALVRVVAPFEAPDWHCAAAGSAGRPQDEAAAWRRVDLEPLRPGAPRSFGAPRIAVWGDSHTAAGPFVDTLLAAWGLQREFTRPSFIPASFGRRHVRLPAVRHCLQGEWRWRTAFRQPAAGARFAKGLVALATDVPDTGLALDFRAAGPGARLRFVDLSLGKDEGERLLVLGLRVNGGPEHIAFLHGDEVSVLRVVAESPGGAAAAIETLQLRLVAGQVVLEGIAPAYEDGADRPVVDVFSVPGATMAGWQLVDTDYLARRELEPVAYDLVLFQFGTNDALARSLDPERLAADMRQALLQLRRVAPQARCIVVGPPDRGVRGRGSSPDRAQSRRHAQLHADVAAVQQRVAGEFACSFWHWQRAMGGPGAALAWARHDPRMMQVDLIHLTAEGYARSARLLATDPALPRPR